jgi:hypothetical protein
MSTLTAITAKRVRQMTVEALPGSIMMLTSN